MRCVNILHCNVKFHSHGLYVENNADKLVSCIKKLD